MSKQIVLRVVVDEDTGLVTDVAMENSDTGELEKVEIDWLRFAESQGTIPIAQVGAQTSSQPATLVFVNSHVTWGAQVNTSNDLSGAGSPMQKLPNAEPSNCSPPPKVLVAEPKHKGAHWIRNKNSAVESNKPSTEV